MTIILTTTILFALGLMSLWAYYLGPQIRKGQKSADNAVYIIGITAAAVIIRFVCAFKYSGHPYDMNCFTYWSSMIFNDGIGNFYTSDVFTDYPPGYMYVLYVIGAIRSLLNPSDGSLWLLTKLPAIICDIITGYLIYKLAKKRVGDVLGAVIGGVYLLNPAVILNSSLWGQVDSVYTLFVVLMLWLFTERKTIPGYFVFALCIFIKPQAFMFMPLVIYAIIENVFLPKFDKVKFIKNLLCGLGAILMIVLLALPFGLQCVIEQYKTTLASYPYLTVNAFNLWGAFGQNWTGLTPVTTVIGYIFLVVIVAYVTYIFFKSKHEGKYFFSGAVLSFATFMLSTKMHDRYAFPTMALLLLAFVYGLDMKTYLLYSLSLLSQYFNTVWVLFIYEQDMNKYFKSPVITIASIINLAFFAYFIVVTQKQFVHADASKSLDEHSETEQAEIQEKTDVAPKKFQLSQQLDKLNKFDYIAMAALMIIYGAVAFYNLGDTQAPQTFTDLAAAKSVQIDLGEEKDIAKLKMYLGSYHLNDNCVLNVSYLDKDKKEVSSIDQTSGSVFYWSEIEAGVKARYVQLSTTAENLTIMELGIMDNNGNAIMPPAANASSFRNMFDEQALIPERSTFMNGTYFDEIYHARTGYEFVHSLNVYEWTHPPLGKDIIALGIKLFGMTPFGWRFMGTLFGILMIPIIYIFARRFLKYQWVALLTTVLFTFDFMHFAQTRIATIDVYVTFFIMLMYYYMYKYCIKSFYDTPLKKTLVPLALSGIFMGFAIASKWTGIYAAVGLAIIFFATVYKRYAEYRYAVAHPNDSTDGISHKDVIKSFAPNLKITILWCCIFFVLVPGAIYCLSYIPYLKAPSADGFKTIIENQNSIFAYHSKTVVESTHPFSSRWFEWILMKRPIWYYSGTISNNIKEGISSFGNPLVWWVGIPAFVLTVYAGIVQKDKKAWFLVIAYVIQIVFWIPVSRTTFIYHYFPCVPFLVLMIGYCMKDSYDEESTASKKKRTIILCCVYTALAVGMFIMFYPVLSGAPCSVDYAEKFLKWFDTWVLL